MDFREDSDIRINNIQARCFVTKDDKILIMFRRKNGKEYYVFPGGHMQKGEMPEQTVIREVEEETTVKCKIIKLAYELTDYSTAASEKEYYYLCEWVSGEPSLSGEESRRSNNLNFYEPKWVNKAQILSLLIYPKYAQEWILRYFNNGN
jgi:8-oxo-dGTP pyrophosphatase MutT (NUDIX family)